MKTFIIIFMTTMTASLSVNGQFLNKLKKAAERGAERAVEREVEKGVQKMTERQIEKAFADFYGYEGEESAGDSGKGYGNLFKNLNFNVATADEYVFNGNADMQITGTDNKGKSIDPVKMKSYLADDASFTGMEMESNDKKEKGEVVMIFDFERNASIMLMENEGKKSSISFAFEDATGDALMDSVTDNQLEKTGRTKEILGYTCDEYKLEDVEYTAHYWISKEPIDGITSLWSKNSEFFSKKFKSQNADYFAKLPEGHVMEMNYKSKEDKSTQNMLVTAINPNAKTSFLMKDYPSAYSHSASE